VTDLEPFRKVAVFLSALAEPTRVRVVLHLARHGPSHVGALAAALGLETVNVSKHLKIIKAAGVVADERDGRHVVYSLNPKMFSTSSARGTLGTLSLAIPGGSVRVTIPAELREEVNRQPG
jgi:ArsR family transcriptional regulator, arsenate/arsenite/antimonite-responsive transcriptional repressor